MTGLIDEDDLIELLAGMQAVCHTHAELVGISKVWQQVKNMPKVDAVPVIRCRNCEHYAGEGMYCAWNMIASTEGYCFHANEKPEYADD